MVGVLILTHGSLSEELLAAARVISGDLNGFEALPLAWSDGFDEAHRKVKDALSRLDHGEGVLILTDIFGATPSNVALEFHQPGKVEVVSGVNLPMVVRLGCLKTKHMPLETMSGWIRDKGRSSICGQADVPRADRKPRRRPDDEDR